MGGVFPLCSHIKLNVFSLSVLSNILHIHSVSIFGIDSNQFNCQVFFNLEKFDKIWIMLIYLLVFYLNLMFYFSINFNIYLRIGVYKWEFKVLFCSFHGFTNSKSHITDPNLIVWQQKHTLADQKNSEFGIGERMWWTAYKYILCFVSKKAKNSWNH